MAPKTTCRALTAMCASLSLLAPLQAALAEPPITVAAEKTAAGQRFSVRVSYADLNLLGDSGVRALRGRVRIAAKLACGASGSSSYYEIRRAFTRCLDQAVAQASRQIDLAIANARSGERLAGSVTIGVASR